MSRHKTVSNMKKHILSLVFCLFVTVVWGQNYYWVFLTDKQGSTFDPYSYFDDKAIQRYNRCGADLYDISNYPINSHYATQIEQTATATIGASRWLNAIAVEATPYEISQIETFPFVKQTQPLASGPVLAQAETADTGSVKNSVKISDQLVRMQGELFINKNIKGKGIRIAVLDAGFPAVDIHPAFRHLRENRQIIDTWNFPRHSADVFGWNSHGTMTLSCIAGLIDSGDDGYGQQLGLATEAEFLLYRTEITLEPAKEEVWWTMAMERADQHGANIISSSLGYGKDRYCTKDMDGTSHVAKAANMAAKKGILVCNSAGNEADDREWKTIITPSDADSVLCVGGIASSLTAYRHISFSSIGPTADGRLKPEVCNFGHALVADPETDGTTWVYGTSFSCPLTAGFAACAWQTRPELTAMQLKNEIMRSADRYPYFDYALGYGVPQASYFTDGPQPPAEPTFTILDSADRIYIKPTGTNSSSTLFYNKQHNGTLSTYGSCEPYGTTPESVIFFTKKSLGGDTLNLWFNGYSTSYSNPDYRKEKADSPEDTFQYFTPVFDGKTLVTNPESHNVAHSIKPSQWGNNSTWRYDLYLQFGSLFNTAENEITLSGFSPATHLGLRIMRGFSKRYAVGMAIEWGMANSHLIKDRANPIDIMLQKSNSTTNKKYIKNGMVGAELFQRIKIVPGGALKHRGIYWDLGVFANWNYYSYHIKINENSQSTSEHHQYNNPKHQHLDRWNWGVATRIGYDLIAVFARYRLTRIGESGTPDLNAETTNYYTNLPRLEAGLEINF